MKKIAIFLLCAVMLFTFVACDGSLLGGFGNNGNNNGNKPSNPGNPSNPDNPGDNTGDNPGTPGDNPSNPGSNTHTHSMQKNIAVPATCLQDGHVAYWYCSGCGKYFLDSDGVTETTLSATALPAVGHNYVDGVCTRCGDDINEPTPVHKHSMSKTSAKSASCTTAGNIDYWYCSSCGKYFADVNGDREITLADTVVKALEHNFVGGYCTRCGASDGTSKPDDGYIGDKNILTRFSDETVSQNKDFYKKYSTEEKNLYYLLWQDTTKITVKIDITPYELAKINEAYKNYRDTGDSTQIDTYRRCNLTIIVNGTEYNYQEVGIRMRGNTSKREFCNDDGTMYAYVHFRFNLSETFDGEEYAEGAWAHDIEHVWTDKDARSARKDRSFATMEKFYYKWNKNYDNTYIREVYANQMFRAYGILAPHITLAQINIMQNGSMQNLGVGTFYETVDKQFIKRNFSKAERGGDLYKCAWGADFTEKSNYGVETPTSSFAYNLKTNDDRTSPDYNHHKYLLALIDLLNSLNKNSSDFRSKLEALVDMDYFTNFEAVNYLLGNPDCIRNNMNNFYIYFVPETGKMFLIPYDYDRCLGITVDWNPTNNGVTSIGPTSVHGAALETRNPLYTKTILDGGSSYYKSMYQSKLKYVLDGEWFTYNHFKAMFDHYSSNYANVVIPSEQIRNQCGDLRVDMLEMSERGTSDLDAAWDNITTQLYMRLKRECALAALPKTAEGYYEVD